MIRMSEPGHQTVSKSRRRTRIFGLTTAKSEKAYKVAAHHRERRRARIAIADGAEPPHKKAFGNPSAGNRDGKRYRADASDRDMRK